MNTSPFKRRYYRAYFNAKRKLRGRQRVSPWEIPCVALAHSNAEARRRFNKIRPEIERIITIVGKVSIVKEPPFYKYGRRRK